MEGYIEFRKNQNIFPLQIPNKEEYYSDLLYIEYSWSGRIETNSCNTFIMEAVQEPVNAVELFEKGYFDCAYYSLRSAVDVSTTMVFLTDLPTEDKEKYFSAWTHTEDFPIQGRLLKELKGKGNVFADMFEKMSDFFSNAKSLSAELNKYVHKQGFQHFYVSRNHPLNQQKSREVFICTFEQYLIRCIGVVAVMRLAIDAFPILLMDKEILFRCFVSITEPYNDDFVDKYIGKDVINQYKKTDIYKETYDYLMTFEKKNEATFDVVNNQFINSSRIEEIMSQIHLLSKYDVVSVLLVASSEKVVKVYCCLSAMMYFTDRKTNREQMSWSSGDFQNFEKNTKKYNIKYDKAYISVFKFLDETFFIEHNELLSEDEINSILSFVSESIALSNNNQSVDSQPQEKY